MKGLSILFGINLALRIVIQGALPIFPVFLSRFGITKEETGIVMALAYATLLLGTWINGKLVPRYASAKHLFVGSVLPVAAGMYLLGRADTIAAVTLAAMLLFLGSGFNLTANGILVGYLSSGRNVGRNFGVLGISNLLGSVLGGFIVGPVLYTLGYLEGFAVFAGGFLLVGMTAVGIKISAGAAAPDHPSTFSFSKRFGVLLTASILVTTTIHCFIFVSALLLNSRGYNIKEISVYAAIGMGLASPAPYVLGRLSRTYPPENLLLFVFGMSSLAMIVLFLPLSIPLYLAGAFCTGVLAFATRPIVMSLVYRWFDEKALPMAQAYLGVGAWLAAIAGYAGVGALLHRAGPVWTPAVGLGLIAAALGLLVVLRAMERNRAED